MRFLSILQGCIIYPQTEIMVSIGNKLKIGNFLLIQYLYQRALYTNHKEITYFLSLDNKIICSQLWRFVIFLYERNKFQYIKSFTKWIRFLVKCSYLDIIHFYTYNQILSISVFVSSQIHTLCNIYYCVWYCRKCTFTPKLVFYNSLF